MGRLGTSGALLAGVVLGFVLTITTMSVFTPHPREEADPRRLAEPHDRSSSPRPLAPPLSLASELSLAPAVTEAAPAAAQGRSPALSSVRGLALWPLLHELSPTTALVICTAGALDKSVDMSLFGAWLPPLLQLRSSGWPNEALFYFILCHLFPEFVNFSLPPLVLLFHHLVL
jgi:hypothetical protein